MVARTRKTNQVGQHASSSHDDGSGNVLDVSGILAANLASMAAAASVSVEDDDKDEMLDPAISLADTGHDEDDGGHENDLRLALQQHNEAAEEEHRRQGDLLIARNRGILDDSQQYGYDHQHHHQQQHHHHHHHHHLSADIVASSVRTNEDNSDQLMDSFPDNNNNNNNNNNDSNNHNGVEIDPKKSCPFCGRTFSHPGSLGRHLDLKRGTRLHPAARVDQIRGNVKRRGDAAEIKQRRAQRAKLYNAREDVKRRAKLRRKEKERGDKANAEARLRFIQQLGFPNLPLHASFAFFVLYFLPSSQWPDSLPGRDSFDQVAETIDQVEQITSVNSLYRSRLEAAYDRWTVMNVQDKQDTWTKELRRALEMTLGSFTVHDIGTRDTWLAEEEERVVRSIDEEKEENQPDSSGGDGSPAGLDHVLDADMTAMAFAAAEGNRKSSHLQSSTTIALDPNIDSSLLG
jgi:hypothetical protein